MEIYKVIYNIWYQKKLNKFFLIFYPLELIYKLIILCRKKFYDYKIFKTHKFNIPVIIVGNITVGGTGKTPLVIYIVNYLKQQGFKPAVVTRGYKALSTTTSLIEPNSDPDPKIFGDEPVLISKNTNSPVIIGKNRIKSIEYLLKNKNINVIVCDDGLQHYRLARDLEIVVMDGMRELGNRHLLPIGPLREAQNRLKAVDLIVINNELKQRDNQDKNNTVKDHHAKDDNQFEQYSHLNAEIMECSFLNNYTMHLIPEKVYNLYDNTKIKFLNDFSTVHAVAGIGNNQRFFNLLTNFGIKIIIHEFPDHYQYLEKDLLFNDDLPIIMTEKDAVKCINFAKENFWYQKVEVNIDKQEQFNNSLLKVL